MKPSQLKRAQEEIDHNDNGIEEGFVWLCILVCFAIIGGVTIMLIAVRYAFYENLNVIAGLALLFGGIAGIAILTLKQK